MKRWGMRIAIGFIGVLLLGFGLGYTPEMPRAQALAKYANSASEFIEITPGTRIHLRDQGDATKPALILIHGSNSSLHTWEPWAKLLAKELRIISLDMPGHGLTGATINSDYSTARYVDVVDKIMAAKKIPTAIIGGNSMGGNVTWAFALAHPDKVRGLILVDAGGMKANNEKAKNNIGFKIALNPFGAFILQKITPRPLLEKSIIQSVYDRKLVTPEMVDRYWELLRFDGNRGATTKRFARYAEARKKPVPDLSGLKMPTLILWGREDHLIDVANAEEFHRRIPNSQVIIYDRVGHIPMEEIPQLSAHDVRLWMAKQGL
jgi:pimeloyl-ACP methyl ester carboxylesterase